MDQRRCPGCNEPVPSNSLTCPSCYRKIPRDQYEYIVHDGPRKKNRTVAMILAVVPAIFGILGLGLIYLGSVKRGAIFLLMGLPLMVTVALLISGIGDLSLGWTILAVGSLMVTGFLYVAMFVIQLFMTMTMSYRS